MDNYIFYITDSMGSMVAVVGSGDSQDEAEVDARVKWDGVVDSRDDYQSRIPITEIIYSTIDTGLDGDEMPGLIL